MSCSSCTGTLDPTCSPPVPQVTIVAGPQGPPGPQGPAGASGIQPPAVSGRYPITPGVTQFTVSGLNLGSVPTAIIPTVLMPSSLGADTVIVASVDLSTITKNGFTVNLSGPCPFSGYYLAWVAVPQAPVISGNIAVPQGVTQFVVSGLGLNPVPSGVILSVMMPSSGAGDVIVGASVDAGTITSAGFTVNLSGAVPTPGYVLAWILILN